MKTTNQIRTFILMVLMLPSTMNAGVFDNLKPVQLATGFQFTEGPQWHPNGYLVFSDVNGNKVYKWSEEKGISVMASNVGNPNGIACNKKNELYVCRYNQHDVAKMDTAGKLTAVVSTFGGKRFNAPNDATFSYLGSMYFTDPDFGVTGRELAYQGLFCLPYNATTPVLLDSTLVKPNGLTFNQDWKMLYVCESNTNTIYTYGLQNESKVDLSKDKKVFLKVSGTGEIDGITSDVYGNLFVAFGDGGVRIYDRSAVLVGSITLPAGERVRNLCFGGRFNNQLFITAGTSLYKVDVRYYGDFVAPGLLSAPTDRSVQFSALSDKAMSACIAFGNDPSALNRQTVVKDYPANSPMVIQVDSLQGNTTYHYKIRYKLPGDSAFKSGVSGTFTTQRSPGTAFSFAVEADPHLDENSNYTVFRNSLRNTAALHPDFLIDLGDNFMTEKFPIVDAYYIEQRNLLYRTFWDEVCPSMPLYIVIGNHEGELGWLNTSRSTDVFNLTATIRQKYYPCPQPNGFYTGNDVNDPFLGNRRNYYAWNWGDALFVVIDPYEYTPTKPTDGWGFTLGKPQYDWFRNTLENSKAKFKFVFAHQIVGGDNLGRGGSERVDFAEMGGKNADGSYGFDTYRPGWGKPIHQIMVENGVQLYFHGHDHLYAEQPKDGIVYLEVPQPSLPQYTTTNNAANYGYVTGTLLPCSGHIHVQVQGDSAKVDYISGYENDNAGLNQRNGTVRRSFLVKAKSGETMLPTPSRGEATIQAYASGNTLFLKSLIEEKAFMTWYGLTGQILIGQKKIELSGQTQAIPLPVGLRSGTYLVRISTKTTNTILKVVL
jgi:sugar lactone lactonase YvrE